MRFWPLRKPTAVNKATRSRACGRSRRMLLEHLENRFAMDAGGTMQSASNLGMVDGRSIVIQEEIATSTDVDMFVFQAKAGQSVEFDIDTPYNGPGGLGSYLRVFDASGRQLAANNDRAAPGERFGFDSYIPITFDSEGTYYVGVSNWLNTIYDASTGLSSPPWLNWYTTGTYQLVITGNHVADPVESIVQPKSITPLQNGDFTVGYVVASPTTVDVPISVYWASGSDSTSALPASRPQALFTHIHRASPNTGSFQFVVRARFVTTAPGNATHLMAIANPSVNLQSGGSQDAVFAIEAELADLDAAQLRAIMVNLDAASAQRLVAPLNQMMRKYGITTLEQRAMFLAQLGHESKGLTDWIEDSGPKGNEYFLQKYWLQLNWTGLGKSVVNREGILLRVPAEKGVQPSKTFELYFSGSRSYNSAATLIGSAEFTRRNGFYEYQFNGAVPTKLTSHLLVVEVTAKSRFVKLAINNPLGNFRPQDSWDFRGRGPIQLTGRYNFQEFANYAKRPDIMQTPTLVSDLSSPTLGLDSAGWFFNVQRNRDLAGQVSKAAGKSSADLVRIVTKAINGGTNGLSDRTARYLRARSILLDDASSVD